MNVHIGMRVLPPSNRSSIMDKVREAFAASPFQFTSSSQVRVLSGEEEGAFGWLAVNYLMNTLPLPITQPRPTPVTTVGAMDFGGASTQFSTVPLAVGDTLAGYFPMRFDGQPVGLYTHSYLGFGLDTATARHRDSVATKYHGRDPCLPLNYQVNHTLSDGTIVLLEGTSSSTACHSYLLDEMYTTLPCFQPPCAMMGVYSPRPISGQQKYLAFSAFAFFVEGLKFRNDSSIAELEVVANDVCSLDWEHTVAK
jgi:adenosinetriphosphatase